MNENKVCRCKICGKKYDINETIRVYGDMWWAGQYCSAQCYTKWKMTDNKGETNE